MRKRIKLNRICSSADYNNTHREYLENCESNHTFVSKIMTPHILMMQKEVKPENSTDFNAEDYGRGIAKLIAEFRKGK